jgi:hypothetical protein
MICIQVKVCCNHMTFRDEIKQVIIHELIHAYFDCVAKNLDWKNCAHHACSEVRTILAFQIEAFVILFLYMLEL